ncbi:divalent-cation tolerance protein CutA [Microvirga arsenatis]|uniref:Divalent cation tolerance protein CutA n=1 Tax=Microvirga arsenatis TaxID=2692265 RepID=A0ABW9Z165_9HYPH|nr:divalent-cation tolerance protein CutA [Microvirga arsenatis]NBJ12292.1 divalent cation tolerance protein CutA [Microvirga arsenatis]NBJ26083.1 divalent cation tolerance protein CutA [Microvirga arsenatis]
MDRPLLVYTTFPDVDTALSIGEGLVRDGLIACINVLPGMRSVYSWKGAIEQGQEAVAILKTRKGLQDEVSRALKERHPYETPVVLFIEPTGGDAATLEWLFTETEGRD